jgi:hypothetical protein
MGTGHHRQGLVKVPQGCVVVLLVQALADMKKGIIDEDLLAPLPYRLQKFQKALLLCCRCRPSLTRRAASLMRTCWLHVRCGCRNQQPRLLIFVVVSLPQALADKKKGITDEDLLALCTV